MTLEPRFQALHRAFGRQLYPQALPQPAGLRSVCFRPQLGAGVPGSARTCVVVVLLLGRALVILLGWVLAALAQLLLPVRVLLQLEGGDPGRVSHSCFS